MARKAASESVCPRLYIQRSVRLANVCSPRKDNSPILYIGELFILYVVICSNVVTL